MVNKYEIVNDKGETAGLPDFITKGDKIADPIKITIAKTQPEGTTVYLRATTKGGVVSALKKITVSFECEYKVE